MFKGPMILKNTSLKKPILIKTIFNPRLFAAILMTSVLSACGSSSDGGSESYPEAYIQFYNVSPNSALTSLVVDGDAVSSSTYGDTTALYTYEGGDYEVELSWEDSDGQDFVISEMDINLSNGQKTLLIMGGDFDAPDIVDFEFNRSELEDEFYIYGMSAISESVTYDLYIADSGAPFSAANFIANTNYMQPEQLQYWDNSDDQFAWPTGDYVLYLTEPGSEEVLFESQEVSFNFESDYFISVRNTTGANTDNLVIDIILNSTNSAAEQHVTATAQFRVYNALNDNVNLDIAISDGVDEFTSSVTGGQLSAFTSVEFGDYQISATSIDSQSNETQFNFDDRLMTLNQGDSKTVVVFEDPNLGLTSLTMDDSTLPQSFQHQVSIANLLPEFNDIDIYFVRNDETIDSAQYKTSGLDYADSRSITVPNDYYSIVVVYEDNLGIESLLFRSDLISFNEDAVYIVTIEPDSEMGSYRAKVSW